MKKTLSGALAVLLVAGCAATPTLTLVSSKTNAFRADGVSKQQVVVALKKGVRAPLNAKVKKSLPQINYAVLEVPAGETPESYIKQLMKNPAVAKAQPDYRITLDEVTVNDPSRSKQYALDKVLANQAWDKTMGEDVKIAIVDSGVDLSHPDLMDKLLPGVNTVEERNPPKDDVGHGTHVAGIAAAIANNNEGIAGLAPKAKILPVKVLGDGSGTAASIAAGIIWAADQGADVINMSLGMYQTADVLGEAVQYALSKNVVVVATMGNDNVERKRYPAAYPGVIAVGSTDQADKKSTFSNYGDWISVAAPGTAIFSTFPTYPVSISGTAGYASLSGTSMAAPLVTGLVGLIRSQKKGLAPAEVKAILEKSADDLGTAGFDKQFGHGRINALKALSL